MLAGDRRWFDDRYALAAVALAAPAAVLGVLASRYETFPLDKRVAAAARDLGPGFEPVATLFNEYQTVATIVAFVVAVVVLALRHQVNAALLFAFAGLLRPSLNVLKATVDRPRPDGDFPMLDIVGDSSFPSGHVMSITVFFGLWFVLAGEMLPRRLVLPARLGSVAIVALTATSRMWAGVHWLSDTYGAVLWAGALLAFVLALRPIARRICARIERARREMRFPGLRT